MARRDKPIIDLVQHYDEHLATSWRRAAWVLRQTAHAGKPAPYFVAMQRFSPVTKDDLAIAFQKGKSLRPNPLRERGGICGEPLRRVLPVLRRMTQGVMDAQGVPLLIDHYLEPAAKDPPRNLPLDEAAGCKVALLFKLHEHVLDLDRVELMAWRLHKFTAEEAGYWFSRTANFGEPSNRWALAGMRIMLGGQAKDPEVANLLEKHRLGA